MKIITYESLSISDFLVIIMGGLLPCVLLYSCTQFFADVSGTRRYLKTLQFQSL